MWFWDGQEHVDPSKEATAQQKRLESHTTNLAIEYAKQGRDWEVELRQIAKERELMKQLGIADEEKPDDPDNNFNDENEGEDDGSEK